MTPAEPEQHLFKIGDWAISGSDTVKAILAAFALAAAYYAIQGRLSAIDGRLDRIEANQTVYVRADVQNGQNERINDKLQSINEKIERIDKKIDSIK